MPALQKSNENKDERTKAENQDRDDRKSGYIAGGVLFIPERIRFGNFLPNSIGNYGSTQQLQYLQYQNADSNTSLPSEYMSMKSRHDSDIAECLTRSVYLFQVEFR
jgi:hypothetical protein